MDLFALAFISHSGGRILTEAMTGSFWLISHLLRLSVCVIFLSFRIRDTQRSLRWIFGSFLICLPVRVIFVFIAWKAELRPNLGLGFWLTSHLFVFARYLVLFIRMILTEAWIGFPTGSCLIRISLRVSLLLVVRKSGYSPNLALDFAGPTHSFICALYSFLFVRKAEYLLNLGLDFIGPFLSISFLVRLPARVIFLSSFIMQNTH